MFCWLSETSGEGNKQDTGVARHVGVRKGPSGNHLKGKSNACFFDTSANKKLLDDTQRHIYTYPFPDLAFRPWKKSFAKHPAVLSANCSKVCHSGTCMAGDLRWWQFGKRWMIFCFYSDPLRCKSIHHLGRWLVAIFEVFGSTMLLRDGSSLDIFGIQIVDLFL